jgi:hypothetical protein
VDDDIREFYRMARQYPALRRAVKDLSGMRETPFPDLFSAMITAITLQLAPMSRTKQMIDLLYRHYGVEIQLNGQKVILPPSASDIAGLSEGVLRERCKLGFRAGTLVACAKEIVSGALPAIRDLEKLPPDKVTALLKRIRGLGEYSLGIIGIHPSFPADSWSCGIFAKVLDVEIREGPSAIQQIKSFAQSAFTRWQSYVYAYILNDLPNLSKQFTLSI